MKKQTKTKIMSAIMCSTMIVGTFLPAMPMYAANTTENSIGSVNQEDDGVTVGIDETQGQNTQYSDKLVNDDKQETQVYVSQSSTFSAIIPKVIVLSGEKTDDGINKGEYLVRVSGNIGGEETINVVPDEEFYMKQEGKQDILATIEQDKTEWYHNEFDVAGNGVISTTEMTAGSWNGTFMFNINLNGNASDAIKDVNENSESGLYDSRGRLICAWDDANIDLSLTGDELLDTENSIPWTIANVYPETTTVVLPKDMTEIKTCQFSQAKMENVVIPNGVTKIGSNAFEYCTNLTNVTIPESVTSIGGWAFNNCKSLKTITIPESVTSIGAYAFSGCYFTKENFINNSSLDEETNNYWDATICDKYVNGMSIKGTEIVNVSSVDVPTNVIIPEYITEIGYEAFKDCKKITNVTIPNSVTSIGWGAFKRCTNLTNVTIPNSVTSTGVSAFSNCTSLTNVTIPESVTSIDGYAFENCTSLTNVTIPNSVTSIGNDAFARCTNLDLLVPNSVTSIGNRAFYKVPHITYNGTATGAPWGALSIN